MGVFYRIFLFIITLVLLPFVFSLCRGARDAIIEKKKEGRFIGSDLSRITKGFCLCEGRLRVSFEVACFLLVQNNESRIFTDVWKRPKVVLIYL